MSAETFLSPAERQTLEAVCDALVPRILAAGPDPGGLLSRAASDVDLAGLLEHALAAEPQDATRQFRRLLRLLGSPGFGLMMAGRPAGFAQLPPTLRERVLQRMAI